MPISSGATVSQAQGSYLKRYFSSLPQEKRKDLENSLEAACGSGEKVEAPTKGWNLHHLQQESDGDATSEQRTYKTSSTCTVL